MFRLRNRKFPFYLGLVAGTALALAGGIALFERTSSPPMETAAPPPPPPPPAPAPAPAPEPSPPQAAIATPAAPEIDQPIAPPPAAGAPNTAAGTNEPKKPEPQPTRKLKLAAPPPEAKTLTGKAEKSPAPPSPGNASSIPGFAPWPPPTASASFVLPESLFADKTIKQATDLIIAALEHSGYVERGFFSAPDDGVVLVTRLERIKADGAPYDERHRWPVDTSGKISAGDFLKFIKGLFFVSPGHYRVIAFVIVKRPLVQNPVTVNGSQAMDWVAKGADTLPPEMAAISMNGSHCTALVYEFAADGKSATFVTSHLTGREHLEQAGILATLEPNP